MMLMSGAVSFQFNFVLMTSGKGRSKSLARACLWLLAHGDWKVSLGCSGSGLTAAMPLQDFSSGIPWQCPDLLYTALCFWFGQKSKL